MGNEIRFKVAPLSELDCKVDRGGRWIEFYASVFNVRDSVGDMVVPGAFKKTIEERYPKRLIKLGRNHRDMIGLPEILREDGHGLFVRGAVDDKPSGHETLVEVESGTLSHASFMYREILAKEDQEDATLRRLIELMLFEVGPVYWPANEAAAVLAFQKAYGAIGAAAEGDNFALADLLAPAKAGLEALTRRDHLTSYERLEVSAALKDLAPFVDRLRAIEISAGGPDPLKGTTRETEPEPSTATTPTEQPWTSADRILDALEAVRRMAAA